MGYQGKGKYGSSDSVRMSKTKIYAISFICLVGVVAIFTWGYTTDWKFWTAGAAGITTPTSNELTIKTIDYRTKIDRSNYTEIAIWGPKLGAVFDENSDYYDYANFEQKIKGVASTLALTAAQFPSHGWVQINPDGDLDQYNETWYRIEKIGAYSFNVYNLTTDVDVNMLSTNTLTNNTVTSENKTIVMNAPRVNTLGLPTNQRATCCQAPLYDLETDTLHTPDLADIFTRYTSFFALKLAFNTTASAANVNFTLASGNSQAWQTLRSGNNIYLVSKEPITFPEKGVISVEAELVMATGTIELASLTTERISVPGDSSTLVDSTTYSTIADA